MQLNDIGTVIIPVLHMRMLNLEKLSNFPTTCSKKKKKVSKLGLWAGSTTLGVQNSHSTLESELLSMNFLVPINVACVLINAVKEH